MHTFDTPGPTTLVVRSGAGHVIVKAEETARTTVELTALNAAGQDAVAEARVEQQHHGIVVDIPRHRGGLFRPHPAVGIEITVPTGSTLEVKAESADIEAIGTFADAVVTTGSGEVQVGDVTGSAKLKSGSGAVAAGRVGKALVVTTGSGDVRVDHSGRTASVSVGSGDIQIGEVAGEVLTKTGSGDVEVDRLGGTLVTKSGSGSLVVRRASERLGQGQRRQREHHDRHRAGHCRLARRLHPDRPGGPGARPDRRPHRGPATRRDHRPHRQRRPEGAPVMRGMKFTLGKSWPRNPRRPDPEVVRDRLRRSGPTGLAQRPRPLARTYSVLARSARSSSKWRSVAASS